MKKLKTLAIVDFEPDFFEEPYLSSLKSFTHKLIVVNEADSEKRDQKLQAVEGILIRYFTKVDQDSLHRLKHLKYIGASSVSLDQVAVDVARQNRIVVRNLEGYSTQPVAEFVFGALLAQARHLPEALKNAEQGDFRVYSAYQGFELSGKSMGIWGLGNIGQRVSELALAFGMKVNYHSRQRKPEVEKLGIRYVDLKTLLTSSDVLGIFLELNSETRGMIDQKHLAQIKSGSLLVSPCHTELFDFSALEKALKDKHFTLIQTHFATLPEAHVSALQKLKNVVLYPSVGIQTRETKKRMQEMLVENLRMFCQN